MLGDGTLERRELHHERTLFAHATAQNLKLFTGNVPVKRHLGYSTGKGDCDLLVRVRGDAVPVLVSAICLCACGDNFVLKFVALYIHVSLSGIINGLIQRRERVETLRHAGFSI